MTRSVIIFVFFLLCIQQKLAGQNDLRLVFPIGHTKAISCLKVTEDNSRLLSASEDGSIRLWDVNSGKELQVYSGHFGRVKQLELIDSERQIVSIAEDYCLRIWDLKSGEQILSICLEEQITSFAISSDEKEVFIAGNSGLLGRYSLLDGSTFEIEKYDRFGVNNVQIARKQNKLLFYSDSLFIKDYSTGKFDLKAPLSISQLVRLGDRDKFALSLMESKNVLIVNLESNRVSRVQGLIKEAAHLIGDRKGERLVAADYSGNIECWNIIDSAVIFRTDLHTIDSSKKEDSDVHIRQIHFSQTEQHLFVFLSNGELLVLDALNGDLIRREFVGIVSVLASSENSAYFYIGTQTNEIIILREDDQSLVKRIVGQSQSVVMMNVLPENETMVSVVFSAEKNSFFRSSGSAYIKGLDVHSGRLKYVLTVDENVLESIRWGSNYFAFQSSNDSIQVYDRHEGHLMANFSTDLDLLDFFFDPFNPSEILLVGKNGMSETFLLSSQKVQRRTILSDSIVKVDICTDQHAMWLLDKSNRLTLLDLENYHPLLQRRFNKKDELSFVPGMSNYVLSVGSKQLDLWSRKDNELQKMALKFERTQKEPHRFSDENGKITEVRDFTFEDIQLSESAGIVQVRLDHNHVQFFDLKTGKLLRKIEVLDVIQGSYSYCTLLGDKICRIDFPNGMKGLEAFSNLEAFKLCYENVEEPYQSKTLLGHENIVFDIKDLQNPELNIFLSAAWDGSIIHWNKENGQKIATTMLLEDDNWITYLPSGYYYASQNAARYLHYVDQDLRIVSFERMDYKFNRPDLVLRALDPSRKDEINRFEQAYRKRLKKSGFEETQFKDEFHLPELIVENASFIPFETTDSLLNLELKISGATEQLDRINVWVNNVPIYGAKGLSIRNQEAYSLDTNIRIQLNTGRNKIECSVATISGAESHKRAVYTDFRGQRQKPNFYFIGLGVQQYADSGMNLKYAVKDVTEIAERFKANSTFGNIYIDTLLNQSFTANRLHELKQKLMKSKVDDCVIVMYSGHGVLDNKLDYYLATSAIDFSNPAADGVAYAELDELLDGIAARQKLVLIDACHSGEVDKDDVVAIESTEKGIVTQEFAKGDLFRQLKANTNTFELMKELYTDLRQGTGAVVISSSSGLYFSYEDDTYKNGVYTYALKKALEGEADLNQRNGIVISELQEYLYNKVYELTQGKQRPTVRQDNLENNFRIW